MKSLAENDSPKPSDEDPKEKAKEHYHFDDVYGFYIYTDEMRIMDDNIYEDKLEKAQG